MKLPKWAQLYGSFLLLNSPSSLSGIPVVTSEKIRVFTGHSLSGGGLDVEENNGFIPVTVQYRSTTGNIDSYEYKTGYIPLEAYQKARKGTENNLYGNQNEESKKKAKIGLYDSPLPFDLDLVPWWLFWGAIGFLTLSYRFFRR